MGKLPMRAEVASLARAVTALRRPNLLGDGRSQRYGPRRRPQRREARVGSRALCYTRPHSRSLECWTRSLRAAKNQTPPGWMRLLNSYKGGASP